MFGVYVEGVYVWCYEKSNNKQFLAYLEGVYVWRYEKSNNKQFLASQNVVPLKKIVFVVSSI